MKQLQPSPKLYRIKPGKRGAWFSWCRKLQSGYRRQALRTLRDENIQQEFFIHFKIGKQWFTMGCVITPSGQDPKKSKSTLVINQLHRKKIKECLVPAAIGEFGYYLKRR